VEFKDYYRIMGVEEKATADEIKKAYKKLVRRYHPDVSKEQDAEQKFKDLGEAYEVLKDPGRRSEYDQLRKMGARGSVGNFRPPPGWESATRFYDSGESTGEFSDFFEAIFGRNGGFHRSYGGNQQMRMRGEDVHAELALLLEEACNGAEQLVEIRVPEVEANALISHRSKKIKLKIPPGTADNSVLRLKGQGAPGMGGEPAGDVLVKIRIAPHPLFAVEGRNISLVVPVLPHEAALGTQVTIPTLQGQARVKIPAGSQSGQKLRLAGKGMPGQEPGDFFVVLKLVMPDSISEKEKALFEALAKENTSNPRSHWGDADEQTQRHAG
jgi:curved DNA-binding protein